MSIKNLLKEHKEQKIKSENAQIERRKREENERSEFLSRSKNIFDEIVIPQLKEFVNDFEEAGLRPMYGQDVYQVSYSDCTTKSVSISYNGKAMQIDVVANPITKVFDLYFRDNKLGVISNVINRGGQEIATKLNVDEFTKEKFEELVEENLRVFLGKK